MTASTGWMSVPHDSPDASADKGWRQRFTPPSSEVRRPASGKAIASSLLLVAIAALSGCSMLVPPPTGVELAASHDKPSATAAAATPAVQAKTTPVVPPGLNPGSRLTLADVVDLALANNPRTRVAWLAARSAEAGVGSARAEYLPTVGVDAFARRSRGAGEDAAGETAVGGSVALDYLLFDFGGRAARNSGARHALIAAAFLHNQAIQDVVLRVEQAYYGYLAAKALLTAQDATVRERETSLASADARHKAGIATIADVLQARTALSQARLTRETIAGSLRTLEGAVATAMGVSPTAPFDLGELPTEVPTRELSEAVETLIERAMTQRPELAAARADAERVADRIQEVRSRALPTIGVSSGLGQSFFGDGERGTPYAAGLTLRWPLFTGWENEYELRRAQIDAEAARENVRAAEQEVTLDVWSSYFALRTSVQRLAAARDLLAFAQQSAEVARSRYRAGVGSILDLLTAEAALENARAQEVTSRTDWFLAVAQLAHDTGTLVPQEDGNS